MAEKFLLQDRANVANSVRETDDVDVVEEREQEFTTQNLRLGTLLAEDLDGLGLVGMRRRRAFCSPADCGLWWAAHADEFPNSTNDDGFEDWAGAT